MVDLASNHFVNQRLFTENQGKQIGTLCGTVCAFV